MICIWIAACRVTASRPIIQIAIMYFIGLESQSGLETGKIVNPFLLPTEQTRAYKKSAVGFA